MWWFPEFASRDMVLPDITMVHGRMLVCAWEVGLEEVADSAVKLVMQTVEVRHFWIRHNLTSGQQPAVKYRYVK